MKEMQINTRYYIVLPLSTLVYCSTKQLIMPIYICHSCFSNEPQNVCEKYHKLLKSSSWLALSL